MIRNNGWRVSRLQVTESAALSIYRQALTLLIRDFKATAWVLHITDNDERDAEQPIA